MEKPEKIAALVKELRDIYKMKAETLAELSGLSLRTIERAESGRHTSSQQTLNLIAKAFQVDVAIFGAGYWENFQREAQLATRYKAVVPIKRVESTKSILECIKTYHASNYSLEIADKDEEALKRALHFIEYMRDICELYEDIPAGNIYQCAKEIAEIGESLSDIGYQIKIGSYTALRQSITFEVLLILVVPQDNKMEYALVTHQDGWENARS